MSVQEAYEALDEVTMVVDAAETESEPVDATGGASGGDAASAFCRFEAAMVAARERLTELQLQVDEN